MISPPAKRQNRSLHSVIFDMDGVILDSHPAHRLAWQKFLETIGRTASEEDLKYILDGRKRTEILTHFLGDLTEADIERYGSRKDKFFCQFSLDVKPIPGVLQLLDNLREHNVAIGLATSASESRTLSTLRRLRLKDHFKAIVTANDVVQGKPDPAVYKLACARIGVLPENVIAVEDAISGVRAAKGAGLRCIAVRGHESRKTLLAAGADHFVRDFVGLSFRDLESLLLFSSVKRTHVAHGPSLPART